MHLIYLPCGNVIISSKPHIQESLVVTQIQINLFREATEEDELIPQKLKTNKKETRIERDKKERKMSFVRLL